MVLAAQEHWLFRRTAGASLSLSNPETPRGNRYPAVTTALLAADSFGTRMTRGDQHRGVRLIPATVPDGQAGDAGDLCSPDGDPGDSGRNV